MGRKPKSQKSDAPRTEDRVTPDNVTELIRARLSPPQLKVFDDPAQYIVARCSRRAGKSYFDAAKLVDTCTKIKNARTVYFGLTSDSAMEVIWDEILNLCADLSIAHSYSESKQLITFPNGSEILVTGADAPKIKDRFRGRRHHIVIIDECAFYTKIDNFILAVLAPTLADFAGTLIMNSSPGSLKKSLFYQAELGDQKDSWSAHSWGIWDNPFFQGPPKKANSKHEFRWQEVLQEACDMLYNGDWKNPTFRREWLGEWVFDDQSLVYAHDPANNLAREKDVRDGQYGLGISFGIGVQGYAVVKYGDTTKEVQVVEAHSSASTNLNDLAASIETLLSLYDIEYATVFRGDHPAKSINDLASRYSLPLRVSKHDKGDYFQTLIATDMSNGLIRPVESKCKELLMEWSEIVRDENRVEMPEQTTTVADAFFVVYLDVYTRTTVEEMAEESIEDQMERQLMEQAAEMKEEWENMYGPSY